MVKRCVVCESQFEANSNNAKYCSAECRNAKIPVNNHVGEVHGELKIKSVYRQRSYLYAECQCSCGKECTVMYSNLLNGCTKTCGHATGRNKEEKYNRNCNRYGIQALYKVNGKRKKPLLHCLCPCGKEFDTLMETFSHVQSCGCVRKASQHEGTDVYMLVSQKIQKNNTSGVRGVTWNKESEKWVAYITFKGKYFYLGKYEEITNAAEARKLAEENLYGNFLGWYARKYPEKWAIINKR